uniref:Calcineurin-like phosphoesterase domain-containing protein n=1 Tax=viral metagenome TaxID=1070528 RepID=A0A6C0EM69_9ZZZZ
MVKFQIASDLHIEIGNEIPPALSLITPSAEILILAGDIGRIHKYEQLKAFLTDLCQHFQYVLYIMGNHEYYRVKNHPDITMSELMNKMNSIQQSIPNLYVLNRTSVIFDDVCVIGCTLWSQALVNIPSYIVRVKGMNTQYYNEIHRQDVKYIEKMIRYCNANNLKLLVVTHHVPSYSLLKNKKATDRFKSLYASHLDHLLDSKRVHTWVCGHIHTNFDLRSKNGTRLVGNQKGKPRDKITDYDKAKVISV